MSLVNVASQDLKNWQDADAIILRIFCDKGFIASTGEYIPPGSPGLGVAYKSVTCTFNSGTNVLTIPGLTIDSTVDGLDITTARYGAYFYTTTGELKVPYQGFTGFAVDDEPSNTTWKNIRLFNQGSPRATVPEFYTKEQVNSLLTGVLTNPMTTLGDTVYGVSGGVITRLAGQITTNKQFLSQIGTGSASAAPLWSSIVFGDVTGVLGVSQGGTGLSALGTANQVLGINSAGSANEYKSLAIGAAGADFAITHTANLVTFNLPTASASNRGALSSTDWSTFNAKQAGDADLGAIASLATTGIAARIAADSWALRTLQQGTGISITNPAGAAGDPSIAQVSDSIAQRVTVRKNTGADVGTRTRLNFIEGSNVTLTIADDAGGNEVDITIASTGGAGSGDAVSVNGSPATDANFINTPASGTVPSITWTLDTGPSPDTVQVTGVGAASATEAGIVTTGTQTLAGSKTFSSTPTFSVLTPGSILFAGTGGLVSQDNPNLFWDDTNNRLGLGTVSPSKSLHVTGESQWGSRLYISPVPVFDLAAGALAVDITIPHAGVTVATGKIYDSIRISQSDGNDNTFTASGTAEVSGIRSSLTSLSGSGASSNVYGGVFNSTNAGSGSAKGVHVRAQASGTSSGPLVAGAFQITPLATSGSSWGVQITGDGVADKAVGVAFSQVGGANWLYGIDLVANGGNVYTNGAIRLTNNSRIVARNNLNSADLTAFVVDTSDRLQIRNSAAILFGNDAMSSEWARFDLLGRFTIGHTDTSLSKFTVWDGNLTLIGANVNGLGAGPFNELRSSRGTITSPTATQGGDTFGVWRVYGHDGTSYPLAGQMSWQQDGAASAGIVPGFVNFSLTNSAGAALEPLRLTNTAKVFINPNAISGGGLGLGVTITDGRPVIIDTASNSLAVGEASILLKGNAGKEAFEARGFAQNPGFQGKRSAGTEASPSATPADSVISFLGGSGHSGSAFVSANKAGVYLRANSLWSGSDNSTYITIETTPTASTTPAEVFRFLADGSVRQPNNKPFAARNQAGSADVSLFKLNTANEFELLANPVNNVANPFYRVGSAASGWLFQKVDSDDRLRLFKQGMGEFAAITASGIFNHFKGADVASAATITPTGNIFHVTGTTTITAISTTGLQAGTRITIVLDSTAQITDGGSLKMAGNFTGGANRVISFEFDGTNWYERSRSAN